MWGGGTNIQSIAAHMQTGTYMCTYSHSHTHTHTHNQDIAQKTIEATVHDTALQNRHTDFS